LSAARKAKQQQKKESVKFIKIVTSSADANFLGESMSLDLIFNALWAGQKWSASGGAVVIATVKSIIYKQRVMVSQCCCHVACK